MTPTIESLGLTGLTPEQRRSLADELYESVSELQATGSRLTEAQRAELDRRLADIEANPDDEISWEELREKLRERFGV